MKSLETILKTQHFTYSGSYNTESPQMPLKDYQEGLSFIRTGGMVTIGYKGSYVTVDAEKEFALVHMEFEYV